jgi:phospholipid-translocating ATPase
MIFFKSIYQAMCIFTLTLYFLENSYLQIVTISFSALVFTELLNIFTLVDRLNKWIIGANSISLLFYLVSVIFFRDMLGVQKFDFQIIKVIFVITVVCWLPFELIKRANTYFFPTVSDKIMLTVKKRDREPNEMLETTPSSELLGESSNNEDYAKLSGDEKRTSF